jgi:hypothetical protein
MPRGLSPLWTSDLASERPTHPAGLVSLFAPEWNHVCGVSFSGYARHLEEKIVWNFENPIVKAVTPEAWTWSRTAFAQSLDPLAEKGSLLMEKGRIASWILMCLQEVQIEIWEGLKERDPSFLPAALKAVSASKGVVYWVEHSSDPRLRLLTADGWSVHRRTKDNRIAEYLPEPGVEWVITVEDFLTRRHEHLRPKQK